MKNKFFCKDRWLGLALLVVSAFFAWQSLILRKSNLAKDPGSSLFPLIGCGVLAVCGILLLIKPGPDGKRMRMNAEEKKRFFIIIAIYIFAVLGAWLLGILITLPIVLFVVSYLFSKSSRPDMPTGKRIVTTLIYTVVVSVAIYLIYVVALQVTVRPGIWTKGLF